jgi:hypothetical protein
MMQNYNNQYDENQYNNYGNQYQIPGGASQKVMETVDENTNNQ